MNWILLIALLLILAGTVRYVIHGRRSRQLAFIKSYRFHKSIREKVSEKYPHLDANQLYLVFRALRDYFWMCNHAGRRMVAMPSQVVDVAWHEFILFTRTYQAFCQKALGRFLHHTPTEAMRTPTTAQEGIKRAWRLACAREEINPGTPAKLPLIFAIDTMLQIPDGFNYVLDCRESEALAAGSGYCAGAIGCASGCAGDSAIDSDSGGFFDGMFDSSGCGADCGGGCGGGD